MRAIRDKQPNRARKKGQADRDSRASILFVNACLVASSGWLAPGFTFSVGKTEIPVIFFVFGEHRDTNFGPESLWFRFQIQKYESQTLVKKNEIRYSENEIVNPG